MHDKPSADPQPIYPATCYIKVIGINEEALPERIRQALAAIDIHQDITAGHTSSAGRYITYNVEVVVQNHEHMNQIDGALRSVDGVKFIL